MIFTIDTDNNIMAIDAAPPAQEGLVAFRTEAEFNKASNAWTIGRLVEIWNGFAGVAPFGDLKPVKKFENREKATRRIWAAIQKLAPVAEVRGSCSIGPVSKEPIAACLLAPTDLAALAAPKAKNAAKGAKTPKAPKAAKPAGDPKAPREGTAKATVLAMIQRNGGATLEEIMAETGWQAHTCRGFISVVPKKAGLTVTSTRRESDKARVYEAK